MKKHLIILSILATFHFAQAQESVDALRYAQTNLTGTARFRAMSGAFGALGGDLSSITVNPAGSAVFINNQLGFTLTNFDNKNESNYFGTQNTDKNNDFKLNQVGAVFVFHNERPSENWKKLSFGINYENTNNFDNFTSITGTNPTNSIGNYFTYYANGVELNTLENNSYKNLNNGDQQAYLGFQSYIVNPVTTDLNNTQYSSNVAPGGSYNQKNINLATGYNGKISFNAGSSYKNKLYFGLNLNTHFVDYRQSASFTETNNNKLTNNYNTTQIQFNNDLYSYGSGFSFQLGAIAKVNKTVRLGLAYESPTWYEIYDQLTQKISAISSNNLGDSKSYVINPRITNTYDPYKLQTPSKWTGSLALVLAKKGLLSIDYTLKDYSNTKFKPLNDPYYIGLNSFLANTLTSTNEIRVGGEYKIKAVSLRAGYRYEQSPYKDKTTIGDLTGYSAGIGYNFGSTKLDLSYAMAKRNSEQPFFSQGLTDGAKIANQNNTFSASLLFEL